MCECDEVEICAVCGLEKIGGDDDRCVVCKITQTQRAPQKKKDPKAWNRTIPKAMQEIIWARWCEERAKNPKISQRKFAEIVEQERLAINPATGESYRIGGIRKTIERYQRKEGKK